MTASHLESLLTKYGQHMMLAGVYKQKARQHSREVADNIMSNYRKEVGLANIVKEEIIVCLVRGK